MSPTDPTRLPRTSEREETNERRVRFEETGADPFWAWVWVWTCRYKNDSEIVAMTNLVAAYQRRDIHEAQKILRGKSRLPFPSPFPSSSLSLSSPSKLEADPSSLALSHRSCLQRTKPPSSTTRSSNSTSTTSCDPFELSTSSISSSRTRGWS